LGKGLTGKGFGRNRVFKGNVGGKTKVLAHLDREIEGI
jgi:hypothetical protein